MLELGLLPSGVSLSATPAPPVSGISYSTKAGIHKAGPRFGRDIRMDRITLQTPLSMEARFLERSLRANVLDIAGCLNSKRRRLRERDGYQGVDGLGHEAFAPMRCRQNVADIDSAALRPCLKHANRRVRPGRNKDIGEAGSFIPGAYARPDKFGGDSLGSVRRPDHESADGWILCVGGEDRFCIRMPRTPQRQAFSLDVVGNSLHECGLTMELQ